MAQSNKFEESFKGRDRAPQWIAGLTEFLTKEHYKRIGVFCKKESGLFNFWKRYVSKAYKERRDQQIANSTKFEASNIGMSGLIGNNDTFQASMAQKSGMSRKSVKENKGVDASNENSAMNLYKKF